MPDGSVKTCCLGTENLGNLNETSIQDIINSPVLKKIQQELRSGTSANCKACYLDDQQSNYASLRQYYQKYYPIDDDSKEILEVLDVRWNNKCNLSCQYCHPHASSVWEEKLQIKPTRARKPYEDDLLNWILPQIDGLREILLQGGEPMLMKQNYSLFKLAPQDCQFSIITNLSYDIKNLPCIDDLLARPKNKIIWNISAENIGSKFEYIRTGANWEEFKNNLLWLTNQWSDTVSMNMVYFIFSSHDILDTIKTFYSLGVKKFNLMSLHNHPQLLLNTMPQHVQKQALDILYEVKQWHQTTFGCDAELYPISGIDGLISGLQSPTSHAIIDKKSFYDKIAWLDSWTDKKFSSLWPELDQYLRDNLS